MAKYSLKGGMGTSRLSPYQPGEFWRERHQRRLQKALLGEQVTRNWLELHDATLTIKDGGKHWRIQRGNRVAEWLPGTATLVIQGPHNKGIKCYDYTQLIECLKLRWKWRDVAGVECSVREG